MSNEQAVISAAKAVAKHWAEFGPEHGFGESMDGLFRALNTAAFASPAGHSADPPAQPLAVDLPQRVVDELFQQAEITTRVPPTYQQLYDFAELVKQETLARVPRVKP